MAEYLYRLRNIKTGKFVSPLKFTLEALMGNEYKLRRYTRRRKWNSKTGTFEIKEIQVDIVEFKLIETGVTVPVVSENLDFTKLLSEKFGKD